MASQESVASQPPPTGDQITEAKEAATVAQSTAPGKAQPTHTALNNKGSQNRSNYKNNNRNNNRNNNNNRNYNNNKNSNNNNNKEKDKDTPLSASANQADNHKAKKDQYGGAYNNAVKYGKRKKEGGKEDAVYGNYEFYYGYRPAGTMDPRTKMFAKELFYQKRCLDIGCNSGHFTIHVALQFEPRYIVGIDIDKTLISKAQQNVLQVQATRSYPKKQKLGASTTTTAETTTTTETTTIATTETTTTTTDSTSTTAAMPNTTEEKTANTAMDDTTEQKTTDTVMDESDKDSKKDGIKKEDTESSASVMPSTGPVRASVDGAPSSRILSSMQLTTQRYFPISLTDIPPEVLDLPREVSFPHNIKFKNENYMATDEVTEHYDVIFCLSVSKWIQLNWGDKGIKKMFQKVYDSLYEGGIFVFEPQPWSSYKKRARITPEMHENYRNVRLKPEEFSSFLTSQVGFKTVQVVAQPAGAAKGFDRPVYLYTK